MKIKLPSWVYETLLRYRNVALPNKCMDMNRQELAIHLSQKVGFPIKIRLVTPLKKDAKFQICKKDNINPYLIAEEFKE